MMGGGETDAIFGTGAGGAGSDAGSDTGAGTVLRRRYLSYARINIGSQVNVTMHTTIAAKTTMTINTKYHQNI